MRPPKFSRLDTATDVAAATHVVKRIADDYGRSHGDSGPVSWSTIEGRIKFFVGLIAEDRDEDEKKLGREASRRLGLSSSTVNGLMSGRTKPSFAILERMHLVTGVSLNWLVCNEGRPEDFTPTGRVVWPTTTHASIVKRIEKRAKKHGDARRTLVAKKQS